MISGTGQMPADADGSAREPFGVKKEGVFESAKKRAFTPPVEIAAIARGVYREFVGLFINDGIAEWIGADVDRAELVEVRSFGGPRIASAPKVGSQTKDHYQRETQNDRVHLIEIVRKRPLTQEEIRDLLRMANALWAMKPEPWEPQPGWITDVHIQLYLIDGDAMKTYGGPLSDLREGSELHDFLYTLRKRSWGE